jgi:hypothetical protein
MIIEMLYKPSPCSESQREGHGVRSLSL